jgi:hypothetical protein
LSQGNAAPCRAAAPASDCPRLPDQAICRSRQPRRDRIRGREAVPGRPPHNIAPPRRSAIPAGAASVAIAACTMMVPRQEVRTAPPPSPGAHHRPCRRQARSNRRCRSRQAGAPIPRRPASCQSRARPSTARPARSRAVAIAPAAPRAARHGQAVQPRPGPAWQGIRQSSPASRR